uniref:ROK family protein n=2 Tax=Escherichia coli TaxID=562 RepID=UPI00321A3811
RGCNPAYSKSIHTWLRFGEIMRGSLSVERYLDLLAVCLGNILTIVDPDLVVIGGGLSNFPAITTQLADRLPRHLLPVARVPRIERARHGDAGGMRGAAFLHLTD